MRFQILHLLIFKKYLNTIVLAGYSSKVRYQIGKKDDIRFISFDTYYDVSSALEYDVEGVPTTVLLRDGKKGETIVGPVKEKELIQQIERTFDMQKQNNNPT